MASEKVDRSTPASKSLWISPISLFLTSLVTILALLVYLREYELEIPRGWQLAKNVIPDPPPQAVVGVSCPFCLKTTCLTFVTTSFSTSRHSTFSVVQEDPFAPLASMNRAS